MILETIGYFVLGALVAGALVYFWDEIKEWLNTVAADAVERAFGYSARNTLHKAVAIVDRLMYKLKNKSVIYSKRDSSSMYFDKTTVTCEIGIEDVDADVLKEFEKNNNRLVQEFEYKH